MAVINYDEYFDTNNYWVLDNSTPTITTTVTCNVTCPSCNMWILNYQWFQYCPYCGKPLYPQVDKKAKILERLDEILKEVRDIKKELESD